MPEPVTTISINLDINSVYELVKQFLESEFVKKHFENDICKVREFYYKNPIKKFPSSWHQIETTCIERALIKYVMCDKYSMTELESIFLTCFEIKSMTLPEYFPKFLLQGYGKSINKDYYWYIITKDSTPEDIIRRKVLEMLYTQDLLAIFNIEHKSSNRVARLKYDLEHGAQIFENCGPKTLYYRDHDGKKYHRTLDLETRQFLHNFFKDEGDEIHQKMFETHFEFDTTDAYVGCAWSGGKKNRKYINECNVNIPAPNGSYFIHFFAENKQFDGLKLCLDLGAKMFDENGELLKGCGGKHIFQWGIDWSCQQTMEFLQDYYKAKGDIDTLNKIRAKYDIYFNPVLLRFKLDKIQHSEVEKLLDMGVQIFYKVPTKYMDSKMKNVILNGVFKFGGDRNPVYFGPVDYTGEDATNRCNYLLYTFLVKYYTKHQNKECLDLLNQIVLL
jgi:hypothetical protein